MLRRSVRRSFFNGIDPIGKVHPDVMWGRQEQWYKGPGWAALTKQLPMEGLMIHGGSTLGSCYDRQGLLRDPEDVRHPCVHAQIGERQGFDGAVHNATFANYGPIPPGSRLLQVLYDNYLEPFSCHRVCGQLKFMEKTPQAYPHNLESSVDWVSTTAALVGEVCVSPGSTILDGVVMRGDVNAIYVAEGAQIMDNVCMITDAPSTLHHYMRGEGFNPYQTFEALDGVCRVGCNTMVEPNCTLDSCHLGFFCKIGHNTKVMKGVTMGALVHVMPGSVLLADTSLHDGELWGGAPARKLGKISKFEWKKPYTTSINHRDMVIQQWTEFTRWGDQLVHHYDAMDTLTSLCIEYEHDLTDTVKAQIREFVEGKEPFSHTVARITQIWTPSNRADDKCLDHLVPNINLNPHIEHNDHVGEQSSYVGTVLNFKHFLAEKRW